MKKRKIAGTAADPTLPKTPVTIDGKTYNLCIDFGALAEAETAINAELQRQKRTDKVNLLIAMGEMNLLNTRVLFAAALRAFHPELSYDDAVGLLRLDNIQDVAYALWSAWAAATPAPEANPPKA